MKNLEMLTVSAIETKKPNFISADLNAYTDKILAIYANASKYAEQKNREIACILGDIADKKAYEEDGFKSVAEYANTIFGIKKDHAYALSRAGKVYNDPQASPILKAMSPSKINELDAVQPEKVAEAIDKGLINSETTQAELRAFAKDNKERNKEKPVVLKLYNAFPCLPNTPEVLITTLSESRIIEDWDRIFLDYVDKVSEVIHEAEVINLPKAKVKPDDKKATVLRKLYISRSYSIAVEFFEEKPVDVSKKVTKFKGKFTKEELMAMLAEMGE